MSAGRATASKLVTCVLPKGKARAVLAALRSAKGIESANVNYARGTGRMTHRTFRRTMAQTEKEILQVVVPAERQDEMFEFIFEIAEIGRPHGGLMFQTDLTAASAFSLPDIPEEA